MGTFRQVVENLALSADCADGFALSAGTQSTPSGTIILGNANGVSFGMSGSSLVTASVDAIKVVSAGTTYAVWPNVSFGSGNGVSHGVAGNTSTASDPTPVVSNATRPAVGGFRPVFDCADGFALAVRRSRPGSAHLGCYFRTLAPSFMEAA